MDNLDRVPGNAALAQLAIDCPWCAEAQRVTADELDAGFACGACLTQIEIVAPKPVETAFPVAAAA